LGSQHPPDINLELSHIGCFNASSKDCLFGQYSNHFYQQPGYGYPPFQQPFPHTAQFYHDSPSIMTPSTQPNTRASEGFPCYDPPWQGYEIPKGSYGGSQMISPPHVTEQEPSSPGTSQVPPAPPGINSLMWRTSSSSTLPGPSFDIHERPPLSLQSKRFLPAVESQKTNVARISALPPCTSEFL